MPYWTIRLERALGRDGLLRLGALLSESGGLTPPEARHWFELTQAQWNPVTRILMSSLLAEISEDRPVPAHLERWLETVVTIEGRRGETIRDFFRHSDDRQLDAWVENVLVLPAEEAT